MYSNTLYSCRMSGTPLPTWQGECERCRSDSIGGTCKHQRLLVVLNFTQHNATDEQLRDGVIEPRRKEEIQRLLTFEYPPSAREIIERAERLADLALEEIEDWVRENVQIDDNGEVVRVMGHPATDAPDIAIMIGGAPFLMGALEKALWNQRIPPVYSFSKRVVEERKLPDGTVEKTTLFRHWGFVIPPQPE